MSNIQLLHGDCLEVMQTLPDNSVDAIVTDPSYFLLNGSGLGFMGKEWDGIISLWKYLWLQPAFARNVASLLRQVKIDSNTDAAFIARENANTKQVEKGTSDNAPSVMNFLKSGIVAKNDSVHLLALTKQEVLDLLREELPSLTTLIEPLLIGVTSNALCVIPLLLPKNEHKSTVAKTVTALLKASECQEVRITVTKQEAVNIKNATEAMVGTLSESQFISAMVTNVDTVANTANVKKFNATILRPTKTAGLIKRLTLSLYVLCVMPLSNRIQSDLITNFFKAIASEYLEIAKARIKFAMDSLEQPLEPKSTPLFGAA